MGPMSLDKLRMVKGEMLRCGREAQRDMHPLEVAEVLISLYPEASLEIERRALSWRNSNNGRQSSRYF